MSNSGKPISFSDSWKEQKKNLIARFSALTHEDLNYKEGESIAMLHRVRIKLGINSAEFAHILEEI